MSRLACVLTVSLAACGHAAAPSGAAQSAWSSPPYTTAHFTFYYGDADRANIAQTASTLEGEYARIVADLGGGAPPLVTVWLYGVHADLEAALRPLIGQIPSWASGATPNKSQIHMMSPNLAQYGSYQQTVTNLVHEFAHCVSLQRNPTLGNNPRWFWESVAIYESGQRRDPRTLSYMTALAPPSLATLNATDNTLIYDVGYALSEFIVARWGKPMLATLISSNADLNGSLGLSKTQFEQQWFAWVRMTYGF